MEIFGIIMAIIVVGGLGGYFTLTAYIIGIWYNNIYWLIGTFITLILTIYIEYIIFSSYFTIAIT